MVMNTGATEQLTEEFRVRIFSVLGYAPDLIEPDRLHRFGKRLSGWCRLFADHRAGVFGCYRQSIKSTWFASSALGTVAVDSRALARRRGAAALERQAEQLKRGDENAERIARLWARCIPLDRCDPVVLYLETRGISCWPLPDCLRFHPHLDYWDNESKRKVGAFPAMVAQLVSPGGQTVALHRTYLADNGFKASVPSPRKLTPACGALTGACVPLHVPSRGSIGVAEGIETALAAWCGSGVPTVAAYSAGNLAGWQWPSDLRRLVVFADNDRAGRNAGNALQVRAVRAGLTVTLMTPTLADADWCDVWASRSAVMLGGQECPQQ